MSKQTAVEWLEDYIQKEINKYRMQPMDLHAIHALNHIKEFACSKAKEMEKEQKIDFSKKCLDKALDTDIRTAHLKVEQHYDETYGGKNV